MSVHNLPEETRKAIFREVVEAEDFGVGQLEARRKAAAKFDVTVENVQQIEQEGITKSWPPLEQCDDD